MLLKCLLIVATTLCFLLFTLGIYKLTTNIEPNLCMMTYMFKNPQFTKIPLKKNFADYRLFYYNEGNEMPDLKALNGAPVLFVPGNGGSYKQVRSLGSVALRMGMGYNKAHLDYFTIDFDEELTALYGGYLSRQQRFLKQSINTVLRLYKTTEKHVKQKIVLVGHSMGGIVAKSMLNEPDWLRKIAVIIFISTPMDQPVIYADKEIDYFYQHANQLLYKNETVENDATEVAGFTKQTTKVPDVVLISIGGGSRDKLVPAPLTESVLSDVHVISTAIPKVWVTCDHLAAMWCLQLMKTINKFLYAMTFKAVEGFTFFGTNAAVNLLTARHYFVGAESEAVYTDPLQFHVKNWTSTRALNFYKIFEHGLKEEYRQAVLYDNVAPYEHIYIAVTHESMDRPWIYGCERNNCVENQMLTQQIMQLPSKRGHKTYALLNLAAIFGTFSSWTHLLISLSTTTQYADLYIDVHNADERVFAMKAPHWFQFMPKNLNLTTTAAQPETQMYRKLQIGDLTDWSFTFKLKFDFTVNEPGHQNDFETIIKIYAPWASGYDRYYTFTAAQSISHSVLVHVPKNAPEAHKSLLYVDIHTDPWCSMELSYEFSWVNTLRNMVQQYYHRLPAHMALIVISSFGCEFRSAFSDEKYYDFLQLKSWFFVLAVRLANSAVTKMTFLPQELIQSSIKQFSSNASFIMHGFAMACCVVLALSIRAQIYLLSKLGKKISIPHVNVPKLHLIFAFTIACISIVCSKCISLAIMLLVYIILIAIANKDDTIVDNPSSDEHKKTADNPTKNDGDAENDTPPTKDHAKEGFRNLDFHVTLLVLIFLMLLINVGDSIAWFKSIINNNSYHSMQTLSSLLFTPVIFVICCLPLLWHLKAPININSTPIFSIIFNTIAAISLLLCEEKLYLLNYVISFVVASLVLREFLSRRLRLHN